MSRLLAALLLLVVPASAGAAKTSCERITYDGMEKDAALFTDGWKIVFPGHGFDRVQRAYEVPLSGGASSAVPLGPTPGSAVRIADRSSDGRFIGWASGDYPSRDEAFTIFSRGKKPQPWVAKGHAAAWSP